MGGKLESIIESMWFKLTGLNRDEGVVFSSHFHSMAFWSTLPSFVALLVNKEWVAYLSLPWFITVIIAEAGPKGRWIDIISRSLGCLVGAAFGLYLILFY